VMYSIVWQWPTADLLLPQLGGVWEAMEQKHCITRSWCYPHPQPVTQAGGEVHVVLSVW
jgi:hypothetical protein